MKLEDLQQYGVLDRAHSTAVMAGDRSPPVALDELLEGETRRRDSGACFVRSATYAASHRHGDHRLGDVAGISGDRLSIICRDPELAYADLRRAVFLDTETTGLGLGAGTYVFLVGTGYFSHGAFHVRQFFLQGPGHEPAFLAELGDFLAGFSCLVTFNGKAFDWPLLESRFVRHRRAVPVLNPPHVDLLHPARRLWKRRLPSCSLSALEEAILGVERGEEDVPGYLIPELYFRYQMSGNASPLRKVFYHNLVDVLSLACLAIHVDGVMGAAEGGEDGVAHGVDYVSLGRVFDVWGNTSNAAHCYEEALRLLDDRIHREECLVRLAALRKRERKWGDAIHLWQQLLDLGGPGSVWARVELAKYYEHVERDYLQAIDQVQRLLELVDLAATSASGLDRRDLDRRLDRLLRRAWRPRGGERSGGGRSPGDIAAARAAD